MLCPRINWKFFLTNTWHSGLELFKKCTGGPCLKDPIKSKFLVSIKQVACMKYFPPFKWRLSINVSSDWHCLLLSHGSLSAAEPKNPYFQLPWTPASSDSKAIILGLQAVLLRGVQVTKLQWSVEKSEEAAISDNKNKKTQHLGRFICSGIVLVHFCPCFSQFCLNTLKVNYIGKNLLLFFCILPRFGFCLGVFGVGFFWERQGL